MSNDEILMRIAEDVDNLAHYRSITCYRSIEDVAIGMTYGLFKKLFPKHFVLHDRGDKMTLFGAEVKILSGKEEWWIVGYLGTRWDGE